jgi:hypothetical protein
VAKGTSRDRKEAPVGPQGAKPEGPFSPLRSHQPPGAACSKMGKGGVVSYPNGGEGTWKSVFTDVPRVIFRWRTGSVLPHVMPQTVFITGLAVMAGYWNPLGKLVETEEEIDDISGAMQVLGILLSFLMVFKTQSAYMQFWQASKDVQDCLQAIRHVARLTVTSCEWTHNELLRGRVRKVLRLLVLHFYVMVEYFQRTGDDEESVQEETREALQNLRLVRGGAPLSRADRWRLPACCRCRRRCRCCRPAMGLAAMLPELLRCMQHPTVRDDLSPPPRTHVPRALVPANSCCLVHATLSDQSPASDRAHCWLGFIGIARSEHIQADAATQQQG